MKPLLLSLKQSVTENEKKWKFSKTPKHLKVEKKKKKQKGQNDQQETSACEFNRFVNIWPIILENRPSASELGSLWIIHCSRKLANNHNFWEDVKYYFAYFVRVCGNYFTRKKSVVFLKIKKTQPIFGYFGGWFEGFQKDFWFEQVLGGAQDRQKSD